MNWEMICMRRLLILAKWGMVSEFWHERVSDAGFLTDEWLRNWYGTDMSERDWEPVLEELARYPLPAAVKPQRRWHRG